MTTIGDMVAEVCGPLSSEDVRRLLWGASSYPFGDFDSVKNTLSKSWSKGGQTVDGAIQRAADELDRAWEAGRPEREGVEDGGG